MCVQILVSVAEHHSNLIPWHIVAKKTGAELKYISLTSDTEELNMEVLCTSTMNSVLSFMHFSTWMNS